MERYFLQVLYDMFQIPMACWDGEASFVQPSSAQPDAPVMGDENCVENWRTSAAGTLFLSSIWKMNGFIMASFGI